jgi:hypothetical protein
MHLTLLFIVLFSYLLIMIVKAKASESEGKRVFWGYTPLNNLSNLNNFHCIPLTTTTLLYLTL